MRWLCFSVLAVVLSVATCHDYKEQKKTAPTRCVPPNPCFPSRQTIAQFAANLTGALYQPSDAEYAGVVTSENGILQTHPSMVVMAANERDVQLAVLFARKYYLMLTATSQSGVNARSLGVDASLLIDMNNMNSVNTAVDLTVTTDPGTVTAQAGSTFNQLYSAASSVGRAVVGSGWTGASRSVSEYTQAGGFGPLSRNLGLVSDNLLSARVVMMDGSVVDVSAAGATIYSFSGVRRFTTLDPGLWHAVRGSGAGSFGIGVSYTFQMHIPTVSYVTEVSATYALYQDAQFVGKDPLAFILPLVYNLPTEWGGSLTLDGTPSSTTVGRKGTVEVRLFHYGEANSATYNAISDLLNYDGNGARISLNVVNRTSIGDAVANAAAQSTFVNVRRYDGFQTFIPESVLTDATVLDKFVDNLLLVLNNPTVDSAYMCVIDVLGGLAGQNSTSYVGGRQRDAALSVGCNIRWNDDNANRDELMMYFIEEFGHRLEAFGGGRSMAWGIPRSLPEKSWKQELYYNYKELLRVKMKYDIDNFLWCHNCVGSDFKLDCRRGRRCGGMDMDDDDDDDDDSSEEQEERHGYVEMMEMFQRRR